MTIFFTDDQMKVARESYEFWRQHTDHLHACALLGNEAGETGFIWKTIDGKLDTPAGDHGNARGVFQWWPARGGLVLKMSGFDVRNGTHLDMLKGAFAEMTEHWSPYRHVWAAFTATTTLWSAVNELVQHYEQSASQASDDVKRAAIAVYLDHQFKDAA